MNNARKMNKIGPGESLALFCLIVFCMIFGYCFRGAIDPYFEAAKNKTVSIERGDIAVFHDGESPETLVVDEDFTRKASEVNSIHVICNTWPIELQTRIWDNDVKVIGKLSRVPTPVPPHFKFRVGQTVRTTDLANPFRPGTGTITGREEGDFAPNVYSVRWDNGDEDVYEESELAAVK